MLLLFAPEQWFPSQRKPKLRRPTPGREADPGDSLDVRAHEGQGRAGGPQVPAVTEGDTLSRGLGK